MTNDELMQAATADEERSVGFVMQGDAEKANFYMTRANNYRLRALCMLAQGYTGE